MYKYNKLKDKITWGNLPASAEYLVKNGDGKPKDCLDACMKLQFVPAQFHLCQELVKLACTKLEQEDGADFETYRLLCDAAIKFLLKDPKNNSSKEVEFALRKMWETKSKAKHMRIILETWWEIKKFSWLAKKIAPNMIEKV